MPLRRSKLGQEGLDRENDSMKKLRLLSTVSLLLLFAACANDSADLGSVNEYPTWDGASLFEPVAPAKTGIDFANTLAYDEDFNIYRYRNFYNGGGVALGDINNDGLTDIYLSGNRVSNRLYLNKGNFVFEDITEQAGIAGKAAWNTGVTMVDINADGYLDLYLCNSGDIKGDNRRNELYLNNQDGTFTEAAEAYGLANEGLSTHAVFFDYDRDGDLDCYLLNNSYQAIGSFNLERNERPKRDEKGGDILYKNMTVERAERAASSNFRVADSLRISSDGAQRSPGLAPPTSSSFRVADSPRISPDGAQRSPGLAPPTSSSFRVADSLRISPDGAQRSPGLAPPTSSNFRVADSLRISSDGAQRSPGSSLFTGEEPGSPTAPLFVDVSEGAGIYGSIIGFGLGVTVGDVDRDGWPDIYVSNDFFERDYLYLNNQDGTFRETLTSAMNSISAASMGADMADINNDGFGEIFVTEMLPATNARLKTATTFENWNKYQLNLQNDYYHQFTRNMLQRNNGDGTYTEVGRMAGVEATDWSWGALIFDFENDGYKDLFVANGIYQDLTNRDFLDYIAADEFKKKVTASGKVDFKVLVDAIPSNPVPNAAFRNLGPAADYDFRDVAKEYGLDLNGFSNGSAYADLDNDGDLDLVVNNVNRTAVVYRNHADKQSDNHWLQLVPEQADNNRFAVGTKATAFAGGEEFYLEHNPMRGFQSSMDYRMHFGLGTNDQLDSLVVEWPTGGREVMKNVGTDQVLTLRPSSSIPASSASTAPATAPLFSSESFKNIGHKENRFSDFDRDPLLYHMLSAEGPALCAGKFSGGQQIGYYLGGGRDQRGNLILSAAQNIGAVAQELLAADKVSEDVACACFDANGDGRDDVYVVSGSSEFGASSTALLDRLYLSTPNPSTWTKSPQLLPNNKRPAVGSVVKNHDVDGDGDQDVFVGSRIRPGLYGVPADSYLLLNDGQGNFTDTQDESLKEIGMVTDAVWADLDGDNKAELIVVGEWMAPKAFTFSGGKLVPFALGFLAGPQVQGQLEGAKMDLHGWYNAIITADLNGDGKPDLLLGNHGLNSRFRASPEAPVIMHVNDFDQNGKAEQIISTYENGKAYPMPLLHDLVKQMPGLRKRYLKYSSFGDQTMEDIFSKEVLDRSVVQRATEMRSLALINKGNGDFAVRYLPMRAQEFPVYALIADDFDDDGDMDVLLGGNFYYAKPEVGRYDAGRGLVLLNDGEGNMTALSAEESGVDVAGEIRQIVRIGKGSYLLGRNNDASVRVELL